ncbi:MAG TPA: class I SAM-dependent methyltransferase [Acetobacteraceae bacterium]|jgi:ubiquinone/menaquinone biosynthesis C-methylase UbiE|nr:class I SAM-dependent methyltransferase [Acetobacteraceae bacterium]
MSLGRNILLRMFGRPRGLPGRLGGIIMARTNYRHAAWVIDLLDAQQHHAVLEVGSGPGVAVQLLAGSARYVAGIDPSIGMLRQAAKRNAEAISQGRVDLRQGSADHLPFAGGSFDKATAINSMQVWPDAPAGLREIWRMPKPSGRVALAFTAYSGQRSEGVPAIVAAAGFSDCRLVETDQAFCTTNLPNHRSPR